MHLLRACHKCTCRASLVLPLPPPAAAVATTVIDSLSCRSLAQTVIDIATLTGAAGVALGQDTGALLSSCPRLAENVLAAGVRAGERLWRLPLNCSLRSRLDSPIADLKNYAGRYGGAITAALFLKEFVRPGVAWAHLDIAGPAWDDAAGAPTGFGAGACVYVWSRAHGNGELQWWSGSL
jgi:leucyl aminopeptidase